MPWEVNRKTYLSLLTWEEWSNRFDVDISVYKNTCREMTWDPPTVGRLLVICDWRCFAMDGPRSRNKRFSLEPLSKIAESHRERPFIIILSCGYVIFGGRERRWLHLWINLNDVIAVVSLKNSVPCRYLKILLESDALPFPPFLDQLQIQRWVGSRVPGVDQGNHRRDDQHLRGHGELFRGVEGWHVAVPIGQLSAGRLREED